MRASSSVAPSRVLLVCLAARHSSGAYVNQPHAHRGLMQPYELSRPSISLTARERATLEEGKLVGRLTPSSSSSSINSGHALALQDVAASAETVWACILDFRAYTRMVRGVTECECYEELVHRNGTRTIKTRIKFAMMGVSMQYFIEHTFDAKVE